MSLYLLRNFFKTGHKPNGSYMGENEDVLNATLRNLSCMPDNELMILRGAAEKFAALCTETIAERAIKDEDEDEPAWPEGPDRTDPGYWKDNF